MLANASMACLPAACLFSCPHFILLYSRSPILAWGLNVAVLYLTMGFRQFAHHYPEIQLVLRLGDVERARARLAEWQGCPLEGMAPDDSARLAIKNALLAHRHVFAVLSRFVLLPGLCSALLCRMAASIIQMLGGRKLCRTERIRYVLGTRFRYHRLAAIKSHGFCLCGRW